MLDVLMLVLLSGAFAGAAAYVLLCLDLARPVQPPDSKSSIPVSPV